MTDVAAAVGVSEATVSRAINHPTRVSKDTLKRVEDAVAQIGFVPNRLAGGLASNRSHIIAFIVPSISLTLFDDSVQTIISDMSAEGYQVLVTYGGRSPAELNKAVVDILSLRPDGVIVIGANLNENARARLTAAKLPVVEAWDMPSDPIDMVAGFSHERLGRQIGEHLIGRGYERPFLVWSAGTRALTLRDGLAYAYAQSGHGELAFRSFRFPPTFEDGQTGLKEAMAEEHCPDVIVCLSDWAAHGAIIEARRWKIRVPQDLAVMGFGDLDFAGDLEPPLTTVRIDQIHLGHAASEFLLQRLRGIRPASNVVEVDARIIVRESA